MDSKLDILFLTETWQTSNISPAFTATTPTTHHYFHVTRPGTGSGNLGGGCGAIISRHIPNVKVSSRNFSTFECIELQFNCSNYKIVSYLVYRPAGHITNAFFVDFESLLIESQMCSCKKIYLGDFNV